MTPAVAVLLHATGSGNAVGNVGLPIVLLAVVVLVIAAVVFFLRRRR